MPIPPRCWSWSVPVAYCMLSEQRLLQYSKQPGNGLRGHRAPWKYSKIALQRTIEDKEAQNQMASRSWAKGPRLLDGQAHSLSLKVLRERGWLS